MIKQILGVGQVLWDLTVNVDFSFLNNLSIKIGGHQIASEQVIKEIVAKIHSLTPKVPIIKNSGGSAANVMSNLAKLGSHAAFYGKCGDDFDGKLYMKILQKEGVKTYPIIDKTNATGQLFSFITPDKDRTFIVFWGASEILPANLINEKLIKKMDLVHMEGYLIVNSYEALWKIFENASTATFDLAAQSIIEKTRPLLQKMLGKFHPFILFSNIHEGKAFTQLEDPEDILDRMLDYSNIAVLTLGEKGVLLSKKKGEHHFENAIPTKAIDTTGAGDSFCAGFLHSYLREKNLVKAAKLGKCVASATIREIGARSFQISQLKKFALLKELEHK